jgi:uncharacterized membrane protein YgaE (UPF0421/DUF939 family)
MKVQVGMAVNATLHSAEVLTHVAMATIWKNISRNLILTTSTNTSTSELTQYIEIIKQSAQSVYTSLKPPCLNKKWYKLAVHGILTDRYADTNNRMRLLQEEIKRSNDHITLAQLPQYMSHPDKHANKAASSMVITVCTLEELATLKCNKVMVLFESRRVTEYYSACKTDQYRRCQQLGYHHATCKSF